MRISAHTAYLVGYTSIRLAALMLLLMMVVTPPVLIEWTFPFVREWWAQQDSALVENAGFIALVGVLGPIPYLFMKSMEMIPRALRAICLELRAVVLEPWLPDYGQRKNLAAFGGEMAGRLAKAIAASWGLIASLATSVAIVMLAGAVAVPPVALVRIETDISATNGPTHTTVHRLVAGAQMIVQVSCDSVDQDQICRPSVTASVVRRPDPFEE